MKIGWLLCLSGFLALLLLQLRAICVGGLQKKRHHEQYSRATGSYVHAVTAMLTVHWGIVICHMSEMFVQAAWIPGVSLLVDFPFAAYPDNFGHWAETLLPIHNVVKDQQSQAHLAITNRQIDTLVLTNLRKEVLTVSLASLLLLLTSTSRS